MCVWRHGQSVHRRVRHNRKIRQPVKPPQPWPSTLRKLKAMWLMVTKRCGTREGGSHRVKCKKQDTEVHLSCGCLHVRVKRASLTHGVEDRARSSWGYKGRGTCKYTLGPGRSVVFVPCLWQFSQVCTLQANLLTRVYYSVNYVSIRCTKKYTDDTLCHFYTVVCIGQLVWTLKFKVKPLVGTSHILWCVSPRGFTYQLSTYCPSGQLENSI